MDKIEIIFQIAEKSIDGKVVLVETGTDCDGERYVRKHTINATYNAYLNELDSIHKWSDGNYYISVESPVKREMTKNHKAPELISSIMDRAMSLDEIKNGRHAMRFAIGYMESFLSNLEEKVPGLTEEFQKRIDILEQMRDV